METSHQKPSTSNFNTQEKASELSIEHIVRSIEHSTVTTDKEIFYYNFSLIGLQLFLINKIFDVAEKSHAINLSLEISIICFLILWIIIWAIRSTTNLLDAYQISKTNNSQMLDSLARGDFSIEIEKLTKEQNEIISTKYQLADRLCRQNLWLFVVEIALILGFMCGPVLLPRFQFFFN
jgi:hypothetical protein